MCFEDSWRQIADGWLVKNWEKLQNWRGLLRVEVFKTEYFNLSILYFE